MSYVYVGKNWCIYREDPCPSLSHIYHSGCPYRPDGPGENICIIHKSNGEPGKCRECGVHPTKKVVRVWKEVCKEEPYSEGICEI